MLKPQDIVVLAWLLERRKRWWRYADISHELAISPSESHAAVKRLIASGLLLASTQGNAPRPNLKAVEEFLFAAVRHVYFAEIGPVTRGTPTSVSAAPLRNFFAPSSDEYVWPDPEGNARGHSVVPLYSTVPRAVQSHPGLYELLALIDALRIGRSRERTKAQELIRERIAAYGAARSES